MLDIAVSYNRYKFIGYEFLTWLWFTIEKNSQHINITIGNRIVLENRSQSSLEKITITGDDAGLEEGILSLRKGALVTELNLIYQEDDNKWQFSLKGESLSISGFKLPDFSMQNGSDNMEELKFFSLTLFLFSLYFLHTKGNSQSHI